MKDDNLYESMGYTDMDLDGDVDIEDAIIYDEMMEDKIGAERKDSSLDDIDEEINENDINDEGKKDERSQSKFFISKTIDIPLKIQIKVAQESFSKSIEDRKQNARKVLANIKRYGANYYDAIEKKRCKFILEDKSLASRYCDVKYGFLFLEAIKDNLSIPNEFYDFYQLDQFTMELMPKLADYDMELAIQAWAWLEEQFLPYKEYDFDGVEDIAIFTLGYIEHDMPQGFREQVCKFIERNQGFFANIVETQSNIIYDYYKFIYYAIENKNAELLTCLVDALLLNKNIKLSSLFDEFEEVKEECINYKNLNDVDIFNDIIIPKLEGLNSYILNKKIGKWEKEIQEYIFYMCSNHEEFAYSHMFSWRQKYKNESLSPIEYENEETYLLAKNQKEERKKTANNLEEIISECESVLMDILDNGNYVNITDDKEIFDFAFNEKKYSYHKLWKTILEKNGNFQHIDNDYVITRITVENILQSLVIVWTSTELIQYCHSITHTDNTDEFRKRVNDINRPLMEYLISHIRTFQLLLLENKAHALGLSYFENPILKKAYWTRREFELFLYDKAKEIYGDYVASGEITVRWAMEQKMFSLIKQLYKDAIYQYKADWLGNQSLDAFVPSLRVGFEYQGVQHFKPVEAFGGKSKFLIRQKLDLEKKEKCKKNDVFLIEFAYNEELTKDKIEQKVKAVLDN